MCIRDRFTTDLKGQVLIFDNPRDCIGLALKALGYSFNTTDTVSYTHLDVYKRQG